MAMSVVSVVSVGAGEVIEALAGLVGRLDVAGLSGGDAAELTGLFARGERLCATAKAMTARRASQAGQWAAAGHRDPEGGWPRCRAAAPGRPGPAWPWPSRWTPDRSWLGPVRPAGCRRPRPARSRRQRRWTRAAPLV